MSSLLPELDPTLEIHTGVQSLVSGDSPFPIIRLACALLYLGGPQGSSTPWEDPISLSMPGLTAGTSVLPAPPYVLRLLSVALETDSIRVSQPPDPRRFQLDHVPEY